MMWHIGIDVSKSQLDVCLLQETDQSQQTRPFPNTTKGHHRFLKWLKRHTKGEGQVCLEATGIYSHTITHFLYENDIAVSVVNPARIKKYAESRLERHKTDRVDARVIAIFCRKEAPDLWTPPPAELVALQALLRRREDLLKLKQQELNRLEAAQDAIVRASIDQLVAFLQCQIEQVEQAIHDHLDQHPDLKQQRDLLTSIPGLGDITACTLLAECRGIVEFDNVRQIVAFAGLNPQQRQSGRMNYTAGISRMGQKSIRSALYMPAIVAMRYNPIVKQLGERLSQRGLKGKQIIVAAMRKLLHLAYGVLKSGKPFDPHFADKMAISA